MSERKEFYTVEELRKRLSISTFVFWKHQPVSERSLEEISRHGIKRIELLESREQFDMTDIRSMKIIGQACESCGIKIVAYHAHQTCFSGLHTEEKRLARVDLCRRQIDTMLELGGIYWGSHADYADAITRLCIEELAQHVEGTEAVIVIENFYDQGVRVEDRMAYLDELNHPQVGLLLDVGHVLNPENVNPMILEGGPTKIIQMCGSRLRHIHLHGYKDAVDHHPPMVERDVIKWVELFRQLHAVGYSGVMNFEPMGLPHHKNTIEAVAAVPKRIVEMEA